jgi:hypothetical protein
MKLSLHKITICWISLLGLTLSATFFIHKKSAIFFILFFAFTKMIFVAFQFMELKKGSSDMETYFYSFIDVNIHCTRINFLKRPFCLLCN